MKRACEAVLACLVLVHCFRGVPIGHAAQDSQPRFQSGVDLITIDVAVLDRQGGPVGDLRARDFEVKLDGRSREVASAELIRPDRAPAPPPVESTALIATNEIPAGSRKVIVAVDQTLIRPGSVTPLIRAAGDFVGNLAPNDYAALLSFPEPGPRVDLTRDHARVREALGRVVGQPPAFTERQFSIQTWEALALDLESAQICIARPDCGEPPRLTPVMRRVLERGCEGVPFDEFYPPESDERAFLDECMRAVQQEALLMRTDIRRDADISVRRLESYLAELAAVEGPKSMVLISAGLVIEDLTMLDEVARLAAAARTTVHVVAVEPERDGEVRSLDNSQSTMTLQDRSWELGGLETVADRTGGVLYRAIGPGTGIFQRIARETAAWYILAVERQPGDPDEQRVEVKVRRRGVDVRASRTVVATAAINASRPREEVLSEALSSPIPIPGVPLRVSTFTQRDAASGKHRLHVAAQVGRPGTPKGEFSLGYVVIDRRDNRVVASLGRRLELAPAGDGGPLHFDTALVIDSGSYALRFGVVDGQGLRGTIVREIDLAPIDGSAFATSDLVVGDAPDRGEPMHPAVEPRVTGGRLAGYIELYAPGADSGELSVALEVAEGAASPALATAALNIGGGEQPGWRTASGAIDLTLLPGRYVARATVARGGEVLRVLSRPFALEPTAKMSHPTAITPGAPITPEMRRRTAAYVGSVVGALSNIVAEEQFTLSDPNRRVTSDFLLVRYPGSDRDLLSFRDVTAVNGKAVPDRAERLAELFLQPIGMVRDRVRQIAGAAEQHVPSAFNPVFVLAFLQADFQSRFALTSSDAGPDWPPQVKKVTFVETARPTLLRAGPRENQDAPARGAAWVEEGTGRVVQTELQIGAGRDASTIVTRFALDERLQIMVPVEMQTTNPTGTATYGNFRRFNVQTETDLGASAR